MTPFDKAFSFALSNEGGYSNDPDDRGGAGKLLQKTLNNYAQKAGLDVCVDVDGAVGPKTLSALCQCLDLKGNVSLICEIYCNEREAYYKAIVENNPSQSKFLRGWLNRLERNRALI